MNACAGAAEGYSQSACGAITERQRGNALARLLLDAQRRRKRSEFGAVLFSSFISSYFSHLSDDPAVLFLADLSF